jgi:hypothetical protein
MDLTMTKLARTISQGELAELQQKFSEIKQFHQQRAHGDGGALGDVAALAGLCRETGDDGYDGFDESAADCFELAGVHAGAERKAGPTPEVAAGENQ